MSDFYELSYGKVLYELRTYHGYKQKDLSEYLNITSQAYSNYENNKRMPDVETLYKIATFYKITLDALIQYRYTRQIAEDGDYHTLYRGISTSGITIPMTAEQAKMVTDILELSEAQQDACQKFVHLIKTTTS